MKGDVVQYAHRIAHVSFTYRLYLQASTCLLQLLAICSAFALLKYTAAYFISSISSVVAYCM